MAVTQPDEIRTPDSGDPYALTQDLLAMADTIQEALTAIRAAQVAEDTDLRTDLTPGRLLSVHTLEWFGMAESGSLPGQGVHVFGNATQTIARYALADPGVPYRVRMYASGFWGRELAQTGSRYDFDMMVGGTPIATWIPSNALLDFGAWRSWSGYVSTQVFTGAQQLGFRGRRIYGDPYGAVLQSQSIVVAEVFSA